MYDILISLDSPVMELCRKNDAHYWALLLLDSVRPVRYQKHPIKVQVWAVISSKGLIGPFFHSNINQYTY